LQGEISAWYQDFVDCEQCHFSQLQILMDGKKKGKKEGCGGGRMKK